MFPLQLSKFQTGQVGGHPDNSLAGLNVRDLQRGPNDGVAASNRRMEIFGGFTVLLIVVEAKMIDQAVLFMLIIVASQTVIFARTNPRFLSLFWMQVQSDLRHAANVDGKNDLHDVGRLSAYYNRQHAIRPLVLARPFHTVRVANHRRDNHAHANDG